MPFVAVNGIQMHYQHLQTDAHDCSQLPLLLLSGMASDSASWQPVVAELGAHYDLLIPDNRCTGQTQPNPVDSSRDLMVSDILALMDALSIERINVLGHSMGAMTGWALAAHAPDRVNHLISACALSYAIPARISLFTALAALRTEHNETHWFKLLYQFLFSPSFFDNPATVSLAVTASIAYPHKQSCLAFTRQTDALETFLTPVHPSDIQCRISLLTGANDVLMTPAALRSFCSEHQYPFTVIPDAAHALHWEQPQAFTEYVLGELGVPQSL
ncbi:MAG: alpha/beta fold hydrolase [Granulosicoccus sp.]